LGTTDAAGGRREGDEVLQQISYIGIDPGFSGAIAVIPGDTGIPWFETMPVIRRGDGDGYNALDVKALLRIFRSLLTVGVPCCKVGLENPTTRPGEGAERSFRFGRQVGNLETAVLAFDGDLTLIPPATWTAKMGFCGKSYNNAVEQRADWVDKNYPAASSKIRGPRGGLLDGRIDAICIAAYLKLIQGTPLGKWGGRRPPSFRGGPT